MAIQSARADLHRLLHWLLHGDAPFPPLDKTTHLLFVAVRLGLWTTVAQLLHELKRDVPAPAKPSTTKKTKPPASPLNQEPWLSLTAAHDGSRVEFPVDTLEAAAKRGDLAAVQWILPRVQKGVNTVTTGDGREVQIPEDDLDIINTALLSAAEAHQLGVVDWLVTATPRIHVMLPLDDELRAVCWYYSYEDSVYYYHSATAQYDMAFASAGGQGAGDGSGDTTTNMPLANNVARNGDLAMLEKIYAHANHRALISPHAMDAAASNGHLDVLKWLHERRPGFLSSLCVTAAAKGGHMHVLRWLERFRLTPGRASVTEAAGAGQVDALRWLRGQSSSVWEAARAEAMAQAAKQGRRGVIQYYHEECGSAIDASLLQSLSACKSVETVEYILDRVQATPVELEQLLHYAASDSNLAVVEYLVTQRRLWSHEAFEAAVYRVRSPRADEQQLRAEAQTGLAISQFLIQQACLRADELCTPLETQVILEDVCILHLTDLKNYEIAEWIARCVPEADCDPDGLLDGNNYPPKDADAAEMVPVVLACLRHRREQRRSVSWMPRWAVVANCVEAFDLLLQIEHPSLGAIDVQRAIIAHSRDGRFMVPLMSRMNDGTLSTDIVTWASSYGIRSVLERVYAQESPAKRQRVLQLVATRGAEHGHVDVLEWVLTMYQADRVPKVIVFTEVASGGARCGRLEVLQWMQGQALLPLVDADKVVSIVREAARHRRVESVRWLLEHVAVPTRVIGQILVDATKKDHAEVVGFLTRKYGPRELSLPKADAARVRAMVTRGV